MNAERPDTFEVECPSGSRNAMNPTAVADELASRLVAIFCRREDGSRPGFGSYRLFHRTRPGTGSSPSTNTSMATRAPDSARRVKPAGPASSPT
jgi:hypothetical protein